MGGSTADGSVSDMLEQSAIQSASKGTAWDGNKQKAFLSRRVSWTKMETTVSRGHGVEKKGLTSVEHKVKKSWEESYATGSLCS